MDIYNKGLLASSKELDDWKLVENNDPKHKSKVAESWREKHNIDRITWLCNSPDLNSIESIWNLLKHRIAQLKPSNLKELEEHIKTV